MATARRRIVIWTAIATLACGTSARAFAQESDAGRYRSMIVVEAESGRIVAELHSEEPRAPASLVKMMLTLIVMDRLADGSVDLTTPIRTSAYASRIGGSQVYLAHGEEFTLHEMMQAIEIASANDACVAVAEGIVGTVDAMVALMNERARSLGMASTRYVNVHGLPTPEGEPDNITTARDAAVLARELVLRYPAVLEWTSTTYAPFRDGKFDLHNTNSRFLKKFRGADGMKTGYHSKAGYNLVATARRDGLRFISVVMGAPSEAARADESVRLLSTAFATHERRTVVQAGETLPDLIYVEGSAHVYAPLRVETELVVFARIADFDNIRLVPEGVPVLQAPLSEGEPTGRIAAKLGDETLGSAPMVAAQDVRKASLIWRIWNWRTPRPTKGAVLSRNQAGEATAASLGQ